MKARARRARGGLGALLVTATAAIALGCEDQLAYVPADPRAAAASTVVVVEPAPLDLRDKPGACPERLDLPFLGCVPGTTCERGTSPDLRCNDLYTCAQSSVSSTPWTVRPGRSCPACPQPSSIFSLAGSPCEVAGGTDAAASADDERLCRMTDGICACTTGPGGTTTHARRWVCTAPWEPWCPAQRPLIGAACDHGRSCDYGSCAFKHGVRMVCVDGAWQVDATVCPE